MRPAPARFPLIRRPPTRLVVAVVLAALTAVSVHRVTAVAAETRARWGTTTAAWLARTALEPGDVVDVADVEAMDLPVALVPDDAVTEDPVGRVVSGAIGPGEVLARHRLGPEGRSGAAALVPAGWRAVAIPSFDAALPVEVGQTVEVLAAVDPATAARVVAEDGVVVHVADDGALTVAVPAAQVPRLVSALAGGLVVVALAG